MDQKMDVQFLDNLIPAFREGDTNADVKKEETTNIERVMEIYQAIARSDFDALGAILADDAVLEIIGPPTSPMAGLFQGRQPVIDATRSNFGLVEEQRPEILSVVAQGDTVIVVGRESGRFRPTGQEYETHWMHQYMFRDGKLARIREMLDTTSMAG